MTQKEAFLKYLQRKDIEMLEMILDDSIIYFGASKNMFLEKLAYIFNQVRLAGEKGFLKIKQHKKQANTYYLLLKIFSYANKFIIEEKDGRIIKMYNPKIKTSEVDIESLNSLEIFFGADERADFIPSNEYVMNLYRCTKAYEEIVNDKIQILTSKDISNWLKKQQLLYDEIKKEYLYFKYNNFRNLFSKFEDLLEELQNYHQVRKALKSFNDSNEVSLLQWLVDCDDLAFCKVLHFEIFFSEINKENNIIKDRFHSNIYYKGADFIAIVEFNKLYHKHFNNNYLT